MAEQLLEIFLLTSLFITTLISRQHMNENEVNANLYLSINEYTNCNISLQELKSRIMNAFENNKKLFCDNNLGCIFILIDSYSDRFTYRGTNKLIYIIKKFHMQQELEKTQLQKKNSEID